MNGYSTKALAIEYNNSNQKIQHMEAEHPGPTLITGIDADASYQARKQMP
jgi:hypothetical protein